MKCRYYTSGAFSDLVVVCNGVEYKVHKLVLCSQSDFFNKACGPNFKVSRLQPRLLHVACKHTDCQKEGVDGKINLIDDDPLAVDAMLHYLYHFDYEEYSEPRQPNNAAAMMFSIRVYNIANKYLINPLKQIATKNFRRHALAEWQTAAFPEAVAEVYKTMPESKPP